MKMTERIFPPTRYDKAPYRTISFIKNEDGVGTDYYIQISDDEDNPYWELLGEFLVKVFIDKCDDETFIDECIKRYHSSFGLSFVALANEEATNEVRAK